MESRKGAIFGLIIQTLFIAYYVYLIQNYYVSNEKLFITYIVFASITLLYFIYSIVITIINKKPNNDLWVVVRLLTYLIKLATIVISIIALFEHNNEFWPIFGGILLNLLFLAILIIQIIIDFYKFLYKILDNENNDNKIGIAILWYIFYPLMIGLYAYYLVINFNSNPWIKICNIVVICMIVINLFLIYRKSIYTLLLTLVLVAFCIINIVCYNGISIGELWVHICIIVVLFVKFMLDCFKKLFIY